MIVFQVSLKFYPVKEIVKMQCQINIVMKKVIILRKVHAIIESYAPKFSNHFSLSLNRIKRVVIRAIREKLNIFALHTY